MDRVIKKFHRGDQVIWWAGYRGRESKKVGFIVAVVPPFDDPLKHVHAYTRDKLPKTSILFRGRSRNHESYLVMSQFCLYWPLVKDLQHYRKQDAED